MTKEWTALNSEYPKDARLTGTQPIYALPQRLLSLMKKHAGELLGRDDCRFEARLRELGGIGFWKGESLSGQDAESDISECEEVALEIHGDLFERSALTHTRHGPYEARAREIVRIRRQLRLQARGYAGWLVTNPIFVAELAPFIAYFQNKRFKPPLISLRTSKIKVSRSRSSKRSSTRASSSGPVVNAEIQHFLSRWALQQVMTPHLVEPLQAVVTNTEAVPNPHADVTGVTMHIPWHLLNPAANTLNDLVHLQKLAVDLTHLTDWMSPQGWGYLRYARLLDMLLYLELALKQRYPDRMAGQVHAIDRAFAAFWNPEGGDAKGEPQTVRLIRRHLTSRLEECRVALLPEAIEARRLAAKEREAAFQSQLSQFRDGHRRGEKLRLVDPRQGGGEVP